MTPVAPTRSDGHDRGVHEGDLPQVLENLRVFVILNAVTNGRHPNPGRPLARGDRTRGGEEDPIPRPAQPAAAGSVLHIVPRWHTVPGNSRIRAIVKDPRSTCC